MDQAMESPPATNRRSYPCGRLHQRAEDVVQRTQNAACIALFTVRRRSFMHKVHKILVSPFLAVGYTFSCFNFISQPR